PARERLDVGVLDRSVALGAEQVLEQDLQRERQARDVEALLQRVEAEDLIARAADLERALRAKAVLRHSNSPDDLAVCWNIRSLAESVGRPAAGRPTGSGDRIGRARDAALALAL